MNKVVLLLGSNLGNREINIKKALNEINYRLGKIEKESVFLKTEPEGYVSDNYYLNMGVILNTTLSPIKLLELIKKIEKKMGRKRDTSESIYYEDRTIDIDIVFYNSIFFYSKKLDIPHLEHSEKRNFSKKILLNLI